MDILQRVEQETWEYREQAEQHRAHLKRTDEVASLLEAAASEIRKLRSAIGTETVSQRAQRFCPAPLGPIQVVSDAQAQA